MAIEINYIKHEKIAKLAWCLDIDKKENLYNAHVGQDVQHNDKFFASGVWDGEFAKGDFYNAEFLCGSGGIK